MNENCRVLPGSFCYEFCDLMIKYHKEGDIMNFRNLKNFMEHLTECHVPGNAVAVYLGNEKVFSYASGYADLENEIPMTGDHYINIYSCSKVATVTAALQLLEKGLFLATDPLYEYIPEYRNMDIRTPDGRWEKASNPILVRDLFTMTAGLDYDTRSPGFDKARELTGGKMDTATVIRCLASNPLSFEPGTHWKYSLCHDALAGLVEFVSGKRFSSYVKENIFDPLAMNHSFYHATADMEPQTAQQYRFVPCCEDEYDITTAQQKRIKGSGYFEIVGKANCSDMGENYDSGGAGITTTVEDYAKLTAALANFGMGLTGERILSRGSVELMRTNALNEIQRRDLNWPQLKGYGYGYGVRTLMDKAKAGSIGNVGEFGWGGAAGATVLVDPALNLGVFYAHHMLNPKEEYYQPRLRNVVYSCL